MTTREIKVGKFTGKAGTVYTRQSYDHSWEVWFEDFCVLGTGNSEVEALDAAAQHATSMAELANEAAIKVARAGVRVP